MPIRTHALHAILPLAAAGCLVALSACQTTHVVGDEKWAPPTSEMSGLKGADIPAGSTGDAPMPAGWKGFKPY